MAASIRTGLLVLLAFSATLLADVVKLRDGREFEGKIVEQNDQEIKLKTPMGALTLKRADILSIEAKMSTVEIMEERLRALRPTDPAKYLEAGKWCLEEAKQEGVGLRLIALAMALDPQYFSEGNLYIGDFYVNTKHDRKKAAICYQRALASDPTNPTAKERYDSVKDATTAVGSAADQKLLDGLRQLMAGAVEQAGDLLESGQSSTLSEGCAQILGCTISDLVDYCNSKTDCKTCSGAGEMECPMCKGKCEIECSVCGGSGHLTRSSVKRKDVHLCETCDGWGATLCTTCKATRIIDPDERNKIPFSAPVVVGEQSPTDRPRHHFTGGKTPCRACHGKKARNVAAPDMSKVSECAQFLERQVKGMLTLWEQSLTRMARVGGPGQVEGAKDLLDHPVWWNGDFVTLEKRRTLDPEFAKGSGVGVSNAEAIRKGAMALLPEGAGSDQFEAKVRKTLGLGTSGVAGAKQVFYTDFAGRGTGGTPKAGEPNVEVLEGGKRLKPTLMEIADQVSARRIDMEGIDGNGLRLDGTIDPGATAGDVKVRIYYTVVDSKESVTPTAERDVTQTRLIVKVALVDVIDGGGKVLSTTK